MKNIKKLMAILLVTFISIGSTAVPAMAIESAVTTTPVEGIVVTDPGTTTTTPGLEGPEIVDPNEGKTPETTPGTDKDTGSKLPSVDDGLKDSLYDGSVLKDSSVDLDNIFTKLATKLREVVEGVRRVAVPVLVIAWMILFFIAVVRIVSGERGATARLMGGLFWVTFAYIGIVSAEAILYALVTFFVE